MLFRPMMRDTPKHLARGPESGPCFLQGLSLTPARAHEFCGPARHTLALIVARAFTGPVIWIAPGWGKDRLHGAGIGEMINPARLLFVSPGRTEDILWSMEESLRAGCAPLVVCDCPAIPGLTPVRRLHLAAETAAREHGAAPLGLLLIAGNGGAPGVESRWYMAQAHNKGRTAWRLERRRARMAPPKVWHLEKKGQDYLLGHALKT